MASQSLKRRINHLQEKILPTRYAKIEDLLRIIHLKNLSELTEREQAELEGLQQLDVEPRLVKALQGNHR